MTTVTAAQTTSDFYKDKGKVRYTIIIGEAQKKILEETAKRFKISQGEVTEVLLDEMARFDATLVEAFEAKRASKGSGKLTQAAIIKQMKNLTPEQLAEIQRIIAQAAPRS